MLTLLKHSKSLTQRIPMKYSFLLIDDNADYCSSILSLIRQTKLQLHIAHSLEEGLEMLEVNRRIKTVVLDGHCFIEPEQEGQPEVNFVYHALHALDDLERAQNRLIPRCVNTELPGEFERELAGLVPVFDKGQDAANLFHWIKEAVDALPGNRVRTTHERLFELIPLIYNDLEEDELTDMLLFEEHPDASDIPAKLSAIRRLLEKLADVNAIKLLDRSPASFEAFRGVSVKPIFDSLYTRKIIPRPVNRLAHYLYSYCSEYGTHIYRNKPPEYHLNAYVYRRTLNSLLELIYVCGSLIDKKS